ncbi:MAG: alpha/beta hydrolase, partial [Aggregatilineales bacterium]
MSENLPEIMPGAGAQFHPGNTIGCLLIHGYMASPGEVGWMGAYLAEQGYTVSVPRLPGHGIDPTHMPRMRWQDWYAHILDMYDVLAAQCERVYVIGHSMGGMLATLLASQRQVAGLVIADTPFILNDARMQYAKPISVIKPYMDFPTGDDLQHTILTEQKKRGEALTGRVNYSKWATRAVHE